MKILETLIDSLTGKDLPVRNVCCGAYWTAVTTRRTGLASTYREQDFQHSDDHCMVHGAYEILAEKGRNLNVAVVGHFPFIPKLRDVVRNLWLIAWSKLFMSIMRTRLVLETAAPAAVSSSANKQLEASGMFC